ncbi:MAG TPA: FAD-binding oxidoreductase [Longimicrobiales bacterium]|nr:FAD-binding oxidoreductase [Longimicrobiales bacterium]
MSTTADRFIDHLTARTGTGAAAPPDLIARVRAAFAPGGFAAVLAPDSADGAAAVLAVCSAEGWPVLPIGAATWLDNRRRPSGGHDAAPASGAGRATGRGNASTGGASDDGHDAANAADAADPAASSAGPTHPPVLLSTMRLNRITEHEPADLVIGVQAGVTLEQLGGVLAAKQQWLPLDPAAAPHATIGAVVANASAGPLRAGHGTPRDMVLGIEIATGDGRLLRFGGRVVKNVAGYDGVRLTVGSRGALGLITALYLRVRGAARADRTLAVACGAGEAGARGGADLALALRDAAECDAIELLSPAAAGRTGFVNPGWHVVVRLLGSDAAVAEGLERCHRIVNGRPPGGQIDRPAAEVPSGVWELLAGLEASAGTALRFTGPATGLADAAGSLCRHAGAGAEDDWLMAAHAADGVIRLWRMSGTDETGPHDPAGWDEITARGAWTMRYDRPCDFATNGRREQRPDREALRTLTGRLRAVFDPAGIMRGPGEV